MSLEVLRAAAARIAAGECLGLATVVATRGSTPQKVGARLLARDGARVAGTLGGGAVEAAATEDVWRAAVDGAPAVREYALSSATDEWGLACGGTMVVFVERVDAGAREWLDPVLAAAAGDEPLAAVTVVSGAGAGRRLLLRDSGVTGAVDDPALLAEAVALGRRVLARESPELADVGPVRLYGEPFGPPPALVIAGAGHVGHALASLGRFLGVHVTVVDDRAEYATVERFPDADRVIAAPVPATLAALPIGAATAIVVAMRNQDLDYEATLAALRSPARYVGLIGARRKAILVAERLLDEGVPAERVRALRAPIGLDIGARSPSEIAVAIVGEWIMVRQGGTGAPLRLEDALFAKAAARGGAA